MLAKRGRFDIAVRDDCIYAVAGSSGHADTNTAEKYDSKTGKWNFIASLPVPVSNIGESKYKKTGLNLKTILMSGDLERC